MATPSTGTVAVAILSVAFVVVALRKAVGVKTHVFEHPASVGTDVAAHITADTGPRKEYDFIIIGGGTAALVLANRLSVSPNVRVLVLEAGQSGVALNLSYTPALFARIMRTKHDWGYKVVPQKGLGGRELHWTRAKLLGGCSSSNAMMFHCGAPEDYDEWAQQAGPGGEEWSYKYFKKYFSKMEKFVPHKLVPISAEERGKDGPVQTGYFGYFTKIGENFIQSCINIGIPHTDDVNTSAGTMGVTRTPSYIDSKGRRVSTESAYLTQDVLSRSNLRVATGAHVTKIIFSNNGGVKRAIGVEFTTGKNQPVYYASATSEVLLCGGAVNSPQIMLLSGVGPSEQLLQHGIPVVHDLPGVGQHLTDHIAINVNFRTLPGYSLGRYLRPTGRDIFPVLKEVLKYKVYGTGLLTLHSQESMAFVKTTDPSLFPPSQYGGDYEDSSSGVGAPDLEVMVAALGWRDHGFETFVQGELMSITPALLRPTSRGSVTLRSADPFDPPVIDPNYLATQHDIEFFKRAAKLCWKIGQTEPLASLIDPLDATPELDHALDDLSDSDLAEMIKSRIETLYHPTSSLRMAPLSEGGVVDTHLRVYGIEGLRVVDASIMPTIVSGHTTAPVIAIAEKAADMIKDSWKELYN